MLLDALGWTTGLCSTGFSTGLVQRNLLDALGWTTGLCRTEFNTGLVQRMLLDALGWTLATVVQSIIKV